VRFVVFGFAADRAIPLRQSVHRLFDDGPARAAVEAGPHAGDRQQPEPAGFIEQRQQWRYVQMLADDDLFGNLQRQPVHP
jgi:hypothetical protein